MSLKYLSKKDEKDEYGIRMYFKKFFFVAVFLINSKLKAVEGGIERCHQLFLQQNLHNKQTSKSFQSSKIWPAVRREQRLVNQYDVPEGETLCGPACAINLVQAVAISLHHDPLRNPKKYLEAAQTKGFAGGANVEQILIMVKELLMKELRPDLQDLNFKVSAEIGRGIYREFQDGREVDQIQHQDLKPTRTKFKVVAFSFFDSEGRHVGNHYEIISKAHGSILWLVDPMDPYNSSIKIKRHSDRDINGVLVPQYLNLNERGSLKAVHLMSPLAVLTIEIIPSI